MLIDSFQGAERRTFTRAEMAKLFKLAGPSSQDKLFGGGVALKKGLKYRKSQLRTKAAIRKRVGTKLGTRLRALEQHLPKKVTKKTRKRKDFK